MSPTKNISAPSYFITCLSISATLLALLQIRASAQTTAFGSYQPTEIYRLSSPQKLVIPPAKQTEILPGLSTIGVSSVVSKPEDLLKPPQVNRILNREIPAFWQMRVPINQVGRLRATYELRSGNGNINAISNNQNSQAIVQIVLEPLAIVEVSRDENSQTAVVQGGVRLKMDLSRAESAGGYSGNLSVTVNLQD